MYKANKVNVILLSQRPAFVLNQARCFALKWDLPFDELDRQGVLVEDLEEARAENSMDFVAAPMIAMVLGS